MDRVGPSPAESTITFGSFRLIARERLLERDGEVVPLGGRALDLLIALTANPNRPIGKKELMKQVWPDVIVDEGSLRFHMAMLRRALGDGAADARYIETLPGHGYYFSASVARDDRWCPVDDGRPMPTQRPPAYNLPSRLSRLVGRDDALAAVMAQLATGRFVTIVGPGGVGKTTLASAVGCALLGAFAGAVHFVDLGLVADPTLVPAAVASSFGLAVQAPDPAASIAAFLRDRRMLLILDGCERVIEAVATLAERICAEAVSMHLLATSREAMGAEGEHILRLGPLASPPEGVGLTTAAEALQYPAVQLFVERVAAGETDFALSDADAPVVAEMCRRLDGLALAIELAAGRVGAYGVGETARLLDGQSRLLWQGRCSATSRHQTLAAAIDWSYDLLAPPERVVFRRLSIFAGVFSLEAALAAASERFDRVDVINAIAGLVSKSLVSMDPSGPTTRYRLLDTTRAYAHARLAASGEHAEVAARHAVYQRDRLSELNAAASELPRAEVLARDRDHVDNVRAALAWSFGEGGDFETGTALAVAAAPLLMRLSLIGECQQWAERAIVALGEAWRGTDREMELQAWLGQCFMFTRGNDEPARAALVRGLEIAEATGRTEHEVHLLGWLHIFHLRTGEHRSALAYAERSAAAAARIGHSTAMATAHSLVGVSTDFLGRHVEARKRLMAGLVPLPGPRAGTPIQYAFDYQNHARIHFARNLWIRGHADQAVAVASQTIDDAAERLQPIMLSVVLLYATSVFLRIGSEAKAEETLGAFVEQAAHHSFAPYQATGLGLQGQLALMRGRAEEGVDALRRSLRTLHRNHYRMMTTTFAAAIAEGLACLGCFDDALATIEEAIAESERSGGLLIMPELLRIKGDVLVRMPRTCVDNAEVVLLRALDLAGLHGALAWQLRTATSLARLWSQRGRSVDAEALLASVQSQFTEGFGFPDFRIAERLLGELRRPTGSVSEPYV
jgi:predicted ATPase/DNA-binding winged helix-turn-helix (wHTH) protein